MAEYEPVALVLAGLIALFAVLTVRRQFRNLGRLKREQHIASDERQFIRRQAWRRIVNGVFLLVLAGMMAGTYLSGMEKQADELGKKQEAKRKEAAQAGLPAPEMTEDEKQFVRLWLGLWIAILVFVFLTFSMAIVDIWATRRYAWAQLQRMRDDHRTLLERDLAVLRQQKANDRMRPK